MRRMIRRRSAKGGLPPGTLVHIGERKVDETKIKAIAYDERQVQEQTPQTVEECLSQISFGSSYAFPHLVSNQVSTTL